MALLRGALRALRKISSEQLRASRGDARWGIAYHNVLHGLHAGLYSARDLEGMFDRGSTLRDTLDAALEGAKHFGAIADPSTKDQSTFAALCAASYDAAFNQIKRQRMSRDEVGRFKADAAFLPVAHASVPLEAYAVIRVVRYDTLFNDLVGPSYLLRPEIEDLEITSKIRSGRVEDITECFETLAALPQESRRFVLQESQALCGAPSFFSVPDVDFEWSHGPDNARCERLRDVLGLVHLCPGADTFYAPAGKPIWLFLLRFGGKVPDAVGHYRPTVFDSGGNRRFFCPSGASARQFGSEWGTTADLGEVQPTKPARLLGKPERVANQIRGADFGGTEIEFTYLGQSISEHHAEDEWFVMHLRDARK